MVGLNKNILRTILLASYIMITALIISGISALFSYLNTGADRSTMLHTEIQKVEQYLPKLNWEPLNNEGRPMDNENLNTLQNDYLDAWYVKQVAYQTNRNYRNINLQNRVFIGRWFLAHSTFGERKQRTLQT